jgi:hypothetical protein
MENAWNIPVILNLKTLFGQKMHNLGNNLKPLLDVDLTTYSSAIYMLNY